MAREIDYGTSKKVIKKEVNYLGRDFSDIRNNLIEFAKTYFPNQYNDFNEAITMLIINSEKHFYNTQKKEKIY